MQRDNSATEKASYEYSNDDGRLTKMTYPNATKCWHHFDGPGNVVAVGNADGLQELYSMDAFGNVVQTATGTNGYDEAYGPSQPYHLTTKELDPDTGLYYFNARWYDASTGRFITRTNAPPDIEHPYALCQNNPVNWTDATGLLRDCDWEHICCVRMCDANMPPWPFEWHSSGHFRCCRAKCLAEYMECVADNAAERACEWIGDHKLVVGTIVVIGGVAYFVATGGSGAIVLIPLAAL